MLETTHSNGFFALESQFKDLTSDIIGDVAFGYKFGNLEAKTPTKRQIALVEFLESGDTNVNVLVLLRPILPLLMLLPFGRGRRRKEINRLVNELMTEVTTVSSPPMNAYASMMPNSKPILAHRGARIAILYSQTNL